MTTPSLEYWAETLRLLRWRWRESWRWLLHWKVRPESLRESITVRALWAMSTRAASAPIHLAWAVAVVLVLADIILFIGFMARWGRDPDFRYLAELVAVGRVPAVLLFMILGGWAAAQALLWWRSAGRLDSLRLTLLEPMELVSGLWIPAAMGVYQAFGAVVVARVLVAFAMPILNFFDEPSVHWAASKGVALALEALLAWLFFPFFMASAIREALHRHDPFAIVIGVAYAMLIRFLFWIGLTIVILIFPPLLLFLIPLLLFLLMVRPSTAVYPYIWLRDVTDFDYERFEDEWDIWLQTFEDSR